MPAFFIIISLIYNYQSENIWIFLGFQILVISSKLFFQELCHSQNLGLSASQHHDYANVCQPDSKNLPGMFKTISFTKSSKMTLILLGSQIFFNNLVTLLQLFRLKNSLHCDLMCGRIILNCLLPR